MENTSPFRAIQLVEGHIKALLRGVSNDVLILSERKTLAAIRRLAIETRLDIRDYELSATRDEQLKYAAIANKKLTRLREMIAAAGLLFSPADVAQLTAQLEQIETWVR
jgi:hypothetical protein